MNVLRQTKESLMAIGLEESTARAVVLAIRKGGIANVSISY
jgi:hypothetical protein